jgi:hypothetical protein
MTTWFSANLQNIGPTAKELFKIDDDFMKEKT